MAPTLATGPDFVVRGMSLGVGSGALLEPLSLVPVDWDLFVLPSSEGASWRFGKDHREKNSLTCRFRCVERVLADERATARRIDYWHVSTRLHILLWGDQRVH